MKVSDYIKQGLKNKVEEPPPNYQTLGKNKEGVHSIECYAKIENGKIIDAKYKSSNRCKKLIALADLICENLKGQSIENINIDKQKIKDFFKEEKEKNKIENRINIILKALE
ncbi:MAG: nicotinate phosphoribosyltransferase [Aquificae bacterium]|nr:nicotinate phosphoribosyltransferase [Aquificota bacterium]